MKIVICEKNNKAERRNSCSNDIIRVVSAFVKCAIYFERKEI